MAAESSRVAITCLSFFVVAVTAFLVLIVVGETIYGLLKFLQLFIIDTIRVIAFVHVK